MYTRLTKKVKLNSGSECISCINFGTPQCHLHNGTPDCGHCPMMAAIFNQLHAFEEAVYGETETEGLVELDDTKQTDMEH